MNVRPTGSDLRIERARVVLPDRILNDSFVDVRKGRIAFIGAMSARQARDAPTIDAPTIDAAGQFLAPGFVDMHVHGGAGADFMDVTPEAFSTVIAAHLRHGVTSIVPTNTVGRHDQIIAFLQLVRDFKARGVDPASGLGRVLGSHLYGPYFAAEKGRLSSAPDPAAHRSRVPPVPFLFRRHARGDVRAGAAGRGGISTAPPPPRACASTPVTPTPPGRKWSRRTRWACGMSTISFAP